LPEASFESNGQMRIAKLTRDSRGQGLVETVLMLPLLILLTLNVVNLAYFFLVITNLTGAARSGTEYASLGTSSPAATPPPSPGPATGANGSLTVAYVVQQDMTGALWSPTGSNTQIQICSIALGFQASGGLPNCETCTGTTCGTAGAGTPQPSADPEAVFSLHEVTINYTFSTLVPGTIFNIPLQASGMCNGGSCTFIRRARMRVMN
jgi:Flp pilus assembly protein TadG